MNGRLPPPLPAAFVPFVTLRAAMTPDLYAKRFYAALVASCLLHAAFVLLPYLGGGAAGVRPPAEQGAKKRGPVRILSVRLISGENATAPTAAEIAAALAGAKDPPAPPMADTEPPPVAERAAGLGLLPVPAPAYYTVDQLTKSPRATSDPRLKAPESGPYFRPGKVVLKLLVNALGTVDAVDVEKSEVPGEVAGSAAAVFGKLRFIPGEINGRRVGSVVRIEVTYDDVVE